jgi:FlaA1/EpsC-like NDP-sugar epimerase
MIRLSGKVPGEDIEIIYTGLRPGEKLYEELFHEKEALQSTRHSKILLARYRRADWTHLNQVMERMQEFCAHYNESGLQSLLKELVPEWSGITPAVEETAVAIRSEASVVVLPSRPALH